MDHPWRSERPQQAAALMSGMDSSPAEIKAFVQMAAAYSERHRKRTPYEQLLLLKAAISKIAVGKQDLSVSAVMPY